MDKCENFGNIYLIVEGMLMDAELIKSRGGGGSKKINNANQ